jgi:hypothetical protein
MTRQHGPLPRAGRPGYPQAVATPRVAVTRGLPGPAGALQAGGPANDGWSISCPAVWPTPRAHGTSRAESFTPETGKMAGVGGH